MLPYFVHVNNIGDCVNHYSLRCFADDSKLSARIETALNSQKLQQDLYDVTEWSECKNMQLLEEKFEYVLHTPHL